MKSRILTLQDKPLVDRYLASAPRVLSGYAFANIFIWRSLFDLEGQIINERFCLFFKNKAGMFMPLPPLGPATDARTVETCFEIMEEVNHNPSVSRIETIEEKELTFYQSIGWKTYEKSKEYLVSPGEIAGLRGDKLKHKRNLRNYFNKNFDSTFRDYAPSDKKDVCSLYEEWRIERKTAHPDPIYQAMLDDSFKALEEMLENYAKLSVVAKVVCVEDRIRAFTSGTEVAKEIFCINFEIADLSFKGLAQSVFSAFAETLSGYRLLNLMDDSGIENIRKTKLSYKPSEIIPSFTAVKGA